MKIITLECINGERNRNKDEIKGILLLKLNYTSVSVLSLFIYFSIVLTFPAMADAEVMRRSL